MKTRFLRSKLAVFLVVFLVFIGAMVTYSMVYRQESFSRSVQLVTSMGNITIGLYDDMNITTANFINLTELGVYDGTIFHRVVYNFVIQGGDPTGTGEGDPTIALMPDSFQTVMVIQRVQWRWQRNHFRMDMLNQTRQAVNFSSI